MSAELYKSGDRVRVRKDLSENKLYGGYYAVPDMIKFAG